MGIFFQAKEIIKKMAEATEKGQQPEVNESDDEESD